MTLTPEQIAEGWKLHDGSYECPIKDERTRFEFMHRDGCPSGETGAAYRFGWVAISAYRIIEAHGADAEPARPTPFPRDYSELVFDNAGWSQTIIVDGKRPEWLRDDDVVTLTLDHGFYGYVAAKWHQKDTPAIRVRRREPKRETVGCQVQVHIPRQVMRTAAATIDLIDGKPDLSTLKIAEDAL